MFKRLVNIIGDSNERELKRLDPIVEEINELEPEFEKLSDDDLRAKTGDFRGRLDEDEDPDDMLTEVVPYQFTPDDLSLKKYDTSISTPIHLLNTAWDKFIQNPNIYLKWEQSAISAFIQSDTV